MNLPRTFSTFLALLLMAGTAAAQAPGSATAGPAGAWVSYRDAYRAMVVFDKFGQPKTLIQNHLQVMPSHKDVSLDGVQLTLTGRSLNLNLPLDATGRTVLPLLKAAYDDNAALVINRAAGQYLFRRRVSIAPRPDGIYDVAELRAACAQALAFLRHVEGGAARLSCTGVRFAFAAGAAPLVRLRKGEGTANTLAVLAGPAFSDDPHAGFKVVDYRFGDTGQVLTQGVPVAIAPVLE